MAAGGVGVSGPKRSSRPSEEERANGHQHTYDVCGEGSQRFSPPGGASSWLTLSSGLWNMSSKIRTGVRWFTSRFCACNK